MHFRHAVLKKNMKDFKAVTDSRGCACDISDNILSNWSAVVNYGFDVLDYFHCILLYASSRLCLADKPVY